MILEYIIFWKVYILREGKTGCIANDTGWSVRTFGSAQKRMAEQEKVLLTPEKKVVHSNLNSL